MSVTKNYSEHATIFSVNSDGDKIELGKLATASYYDDDNDFAIGKFAILEKDGKARTRSTKLEKSVSDAWQAHLYMKDQGYKLLDVRNNSELSIQTYQPQNPIIVDNPNDWNRYWADKPRRPANEVHHVIELTFPIYGNRDVEIREMLWYLWCTNGARHIHRLNHHKIAQSTLTPTYIEAITEDWELPKIIKSHGNDIIPQLLAGDKAGFLDENKYHKIKSLLRQLSSQLRKDRQVIDLSQYGANARRAIKKLSPLNLDNPFNEEGKPNGNPYAPVWLLNSLNKHLEYVDNGNLSVGQVESWVTNAINDHEYNSAKSHDTVRILDKQQMYTEVLSSLVDSSL